MYIHIYTFVLYIYIYVYFYISKLQSKAAPCQSEVVVLTNGFDAEWCDLEKCASPPPRPTPILRKSLERTKPLATNDLECGPKRPKGRCQSDRLEESAIF